MRMLCYDDGLGAGKNLLALKTTDAKQQDCSIWVYQCSSAVSVCVESIGSITSFTTNSDQHLLTYPPPPTTQLTSTVSYE